MSIENENSEVQNNVELSFDETGTEATNVLSDIPPMDEDGVQEISFEVSTVPDIEASVAMESDIQIPDDANGPYIPDELSAGLDEITDPDLATTAIDDQVAGVDDGDFSLDHSAISEVADNELVLDEAVDPVIPAALAAAPAAAKAGLFGKLFKKTKPSEDDGAKSSSGNAGLFSFKKKKIQEEVAMTMTRTSKTQTGTETAEAKKSALSMILGNKKYMISGLVLVASIGGLVTSLEMKTSSYSRATAGVEAAATVQTLMQDLVRNAHSAAAGDEKSLAAIMATAGEISKRIEILKSYRGSDPAIDDSLKTVGSAWVSLEEYVKSIESNKDSIAGISKNVDAVVINANRVSAYADQAVAIMLQNGATDNEMARATSIQKLSSRVPEEVKDLVTSGASKNASEVATAIASINDDTWATGIAVNALANGDNAGNPPATNPGVLSRMVDATAASDAFGNSVSSVVRNMYGIIAAKKSIDGIDGMSAHMNETVSKLGASIENLRSGNMKYTLAIVLSSLLAVASLGFILWSNAAEARRRAIDTQRDKQRQESAIMNLVDDIENLANGDLSSKARVTEDITGVIADSINMTIDELRRIISEINKSSGDVSVLTGEFANSAESLSSAAERQMTEVSSTTDAVQRMNESIAMVANQGKQAAEVAEESLAAAGQGVEAVQATIANMEQIRVNMQETSKRIKRLGESSQEVSEIADLISEVTEKTNILALNAFVQAAAAGEQGRGFRVVATEIQRLAEGTSQSLARIVGLIQTIQDDMKEAISTMEQSTNGVIDGARLSDSAGQALEQIRAISGRLAGVVESISAATSKQAEESAVVSDSMEKILDITHTTHAGIGEAKDSISAIQSTTSALQTSVSGFKMPA